MSIRSKYTNRTPRRRASAQAPQPSPVAPKSSTASTAAKVAKGALVTSGNALKKFAGWVAKNQQEYAKKTGDTSLEEDLRNIPIRVCRNTGNAGRAESQRIRDRCIAEKDEDLTRYITGHPKKRRDPEPPQYIEFTIKPKVKRKPKAKTIRVQYDPNAEVGYYGKK